MKTGSITSVLGLHLVSNRGFRSHIQVQQLLRMPDNYENNLGRKCELSLTYGVCNSNFQIIITAK